MKEISDILEEYRRTDFSRRKAALATVVKVEGSSYRQPGARMLITDDGRLTGAISGGCLEGDALRKALLVMAEGKPMLVTYDTSDEDDAIVGIGLGCNGIIHILIEPIDPLNAENPVRLLKMATEKRRKAVLVSLFSMSDYSNYQPGTCFLTAGDDVVAGSLPDEVPKDIMVAAAAEVMQCGHSYIKQIESDHSELFAFIDLIHPVVSLVIFGAGNDAMPLVHVAEILGWQITMIDGRPLYATCQRFPSVHQVLVAEAKEALSGFIPDDHTVAVLMSHNYNYDLAILKNLVRYPLPYIGVLGPKSKLNRMLEELGSEINHEDGVQYIYGPVGLDIGAETSEEIAISIVAEIKAVLAGKMGKSLRYKNEPIHKRPSEKWNQLA